MDWIGLDWIGLDGIGLVGIGLVGMDWDELGWIAIQYNNAVCSAHCSSTVHQVHNLIQLYLCSCADMLIPLKVFKQQ